MGVDGIWLSPVTVSPNADWGYDVADFLAIQPDLGTIEDLDRLIAEAAERGIRVLMDLVPNHTSDQHPWFVDSRSSREAPPSRLVRVGRPQDPTDRPPTTGCPVSAGRRGPSTRPPASTTCTTTLTSSPISTGGTTRCATTFDDILAFWLDRGVAGFRIDVCNIIIKDALLRDNPPATEDDPFDAQLFGQRPVYNANRPEVHDVLRRWRRLADAHPVSVLVGETPVEGADALAAYYGDGTDELHLAFNFPFISSPLEAAAMRTIVEDTEKALPPGGLAGVDRLEPRHVPVRHPLGRRRPGHRARVALLMLLCLRGTPVLYQGDEIGQGDVDVPHEQMRDPLGVRYWPAYAGRDAMRTPMPWRDVDRRWLHRTRGHARGCRSATSAPAPWRLSGTIPTRCSP